MTATDLYDIYNNFDKLLGLKLTEISPGIITYELEVVEHHLSSPKVGHGAVIASMMDAILGTTALSKVMPEGNLVSTVEFKINYFKPILIGDSLLATGEIEFQGKSLIVTTGTIIKQNTQELVSKGMGTFNIYPMSKRGLSI